jgi:hypothetical protein
MLEKCKNQTRKGWKKKTEKINGEAKILKGTGRKLRDTRKSKRVLYKKNFIEEEHGDDVVVDRSKRGKLKTQKLKNKNKSVDKHGKNRSGSVKNSKTLCNRNREDLLKYCVY